MVVYHYSQTLKEGDQLEPGHQDFTDLCSPFMQAMTVSKDCFYGMLLNGKYMFAVLAATSFLQGIKKAPFVP